jgi:hypothetical protein
MIDSCFYLPLWRPSPLEYLSPLCIVLIFFSSIYCRLMAGRSTSGIGSSYASSTPTLSNSTMPSVDNVGVGTQNPSSALPPKPKKSEQTSIVWDHFTKAEGGDPEDPKSQRNYCKKLFSCHSKRLGTSSMLTHLKSTCKKYSGKFDKSQSKLSFEVKEGGMSVGEGCVGNMVIAKYNATKISK